MVLLIGYFDCFSGASGDMILGALADAGFPFAKLKNELKKLNLNNEFKIKKSTVKKHSISATKINVLQQKILPPRSFAEITNLIQKSSLEESIKKLSLKIFHQIALAEAKIHKQKINGAHFHEVGAIDSIIDIVGAAICLSRMNFKNLYASPLPLGKGFVKTLHGTLPIPSPATLEILKDVLVYQGSTENEMVTPTGAAILKVCVSKFCEMPVFKIKNIGYGAGDKDFQAPNVLRFIIGEPIATEVGLEEELVVVSTNIDDTNPEFYDYVQKKLFKNGALDVWFVPIYMKKSRPATTLNLLCDQEKTEKLSEIVFKETNTFGMRISKTKRLKLARKITDVKIKEGKAKVKAGLLNNKIITISPEYEDCAKIASKTKIPLKKVYELIKEAASKKLTQQ
ncbi:MAG: nickel pincer cofactor biosynthesis protein LarC [Actinobacteria bacterium]|nr:nickel pincer cofactor biosynthesis protein LarC [Actinomycetota bacterium]